MNKRIVFCLPMLLIWSSCTFAEFDAKEMAKQLMQNIYMQNLDKPKKERIQALDNIKEQILAEFKSKPDDPVIWWLDGLADLGYVYAWNLSWKDDPKNIDIIQDQKMVAVEKFRKALELDNPDSAKLDLDMLYSLKKFGSSDVHVEAGSRILAVDKNIDSKKEIEIRGGMIQHLLRLERYDDVMVQIEIIEQNYPNTEYAQGARSHYTNVIADAKQNQQAENIPEEKPTPPIEQIKQPEPVGQKPVVKPTPQPTYNTSGPPASDKRESKRSVQEPAPQIDMAPKDSELNPIQSTSIIKLEWILYLLVIGIVIVLYVIKRPRKHSVE